MIDSSTRLLEELKTTPSSSYAGHSNYVESRKHHVRELTTRYRVMQGWFVRCSWTRKIRLLTEMFDCLSISALSAILNLLMTIYGSSYTYSSLEASSNFIYDKSLNDHNRAMDSRTLQKVQNENVKWFASLDEQSEQIMILTGLLRLGGGSILYHMYKRGVSMYYELLEEAKSPEHPIPPQADKPPKSQTVLESHVDNPFAEEVEKCTQAWNDAMRQYRFEDTKKSDAKKGKTKGKDMKVKKDGDELDWIQLMPIPIVKRIFSYLDAKTLTKIMAVNKYWSCAVKDYQSELKCRKTLSKFISKLEKGVPPVDLKIHQVTAQVRSPIKKRLVRLWERGAICPRLTSAFNKPLRDTDAFMKNSNERNNYLLDIEHVALFPTCVSGSQSLYEPLETECLGYSSP